MRVLHEDLSCNTYRADLVQVSECPLSCGGAYGFPITPNMRMWHWLCVGFPEQGQAKFLAGSNVCTPRSPSLVGSKASASTGVSIVFVLLNRCTTLQEFVHCRSTNTWQIVVSCTFHCKNLALHPTGSGQHFAVEVVWQTAWKPVEERIPWDKGNSRR